MITSIDIQCHMNKMAPSTKGLELIMRENMQLVWEVSEIAKIIGRSNRQTFHMLNKGELPAKKVGGRWVAERGKLIAFFLEDAE